MGYLTFAELPKGIKTQATYQGATAKQIIFQQGETTDAIHFLLEGQIRLASFTGELIVNYYFVLPGESVAETALFGKTYFCTAIANSPSRVASIDKEVFRQAIA